MRLALLALFSVVCLPAFGADSSVPSSAAKPITLEEAIQLALAKNYAIKVDSYSVPIAKAGITAAWGKFDPALSFSYNYSQDRNPQPTDPFSGARPPSFVSDADTYQAGVGGDLPIGTHYNLGGNLSNQRGTSNSFENQYYSFAGLSIRQPVLRNFGFGANLVQLRVARANRRVSEWQYRQTLIDTVTNVLDAYYELYYAERGLQIALRSRDLATSLVAENEKRNKYGGMSEYDVIFARARAASVEESILFAQRSLLDSKNLLKKLISDDRSLALLGRDIEIVPPGEPSLPESVDPAVGFRQALTERPDYQKLIAQVQSARAQRDASANQLLPQIDFVGSYGYNGLGSTSGESRHALLRRDTPSWTAGAELNIPFTFAKQRGNYVQAKLQLRQTEAQLEQLEQSVLVSVGNAAGQIETAQKRLAATRLARQLAQQTLDADLKKLHAGTTTTYYVSNSQELLIAAEGREARTVTDALEAVAEYDRQIGNTLKTHHIVVDDSVAPNQPAERPGVKSPNPR